MPFPRPGPIPTSSVSGGRDDCGVLSRSRPKSSGFTPSDIRSEPDSASSPDGLPVSVSSASPVGASPKMSSHLLHPRRSRTPLTFPSGNFLPVFDLNFLQNEIVLLDDFRPFFRALSSSSDISASLWFECCLLNCNDTTVARVSIEIPSERSIIAYLSRFVNSLPIKNKTPREIREG